MRKGYLSRIIWIIATLGTFSEQSPVVSNAGNNENTTKVSGSVLSTSVLLGATSAKMQTSTVSNMTNEWSKTTSGLEANSAFSTATKNRKTANATSILPTIVTRRTSNSAASTQGIVPTSTQTKEDTFAKKGIVPTSTQTKEDTFAKKGVKGENKRNIIYVGIIIALTMLVAILLMVITYYFYRNRALKLSNARVENVCTGIEEPVDLIPDKGGEVIENKGEEGDTTTNQDEEITPKQDEEIATVMQDGEITPNQDEEIAKVKQDEEIAATKFDEEITTNQDEEINKIQIEAIVTSAEITTEHGDEMVNQQDEKEAYNHDNTMTVKETEF